MPPPPDTPSDAVVLLHGLGRTRRAMARMERALRRAGYRTRNRSYPSTRHGIERLAREVVGGRLAEVLAWDPAPPRVHFVTHSLGGVLVRWYAAHVGLPAGTRAVMIAPPHGGSEVAERLRDTWPFCRYCGPSLAELGTGPSSVPLGLGPLRGVEAAVVAGGRSWFPFFDGLFEGASDGIVALARARVEGAADFLEVPCGHTFIAARPETIRQALHFLRHGRFDAQAGANGGGVGIRGPRSGALSARPARATLPGSDPLRP